MRIAIATVQVPFMTGGAEIHAANLRRALETHGHDVEIVTLPFKWYPPQQIVKQILIARLLDLSESNGKAIDRLIGMKFPAYYARHPNKILWILHQHRQAYDLWGTEYCDLRRFPEGARVRQVIWQADKRFIPEARAVYANSAEVARRLKVYNNLDAPPLYHPPDQAESFHCNGYGDYVFYPSRLEAAKRQLLLVEAMTQVRSPVRCVLAGSQSWGEVKERIEEIVRCKNLQEKVLLAGPITHEEKVRYYADALAVFFGPFGEDYGYVTLEALLSRKPVITCTDSGGPLEFVEHGATGYVVEPDPQAIAEALDQLYWEKEQARRMGEAGYALYQAKEISWEKVVEALLQC